MEETARESEQEKAKGTAKPAAAPVVEDKTFIDVLKGLLGKLVMIVNPESFEDATIGQQITAGWYRGKPIAIGKDYIVVATEYLRRGKKGAKDPVKQYIPISRIKRISFIKSERLIHI